MAPKCNNCNNAAILKRPKTCHALCKDCFFHCFEEEIHTSIINEKLFEPGETIALGASGGKDSTVLIHVLKTLNERHNYGIKLMLLSIDEGIAGYRDDSLKTVLLNQKFYDIPLKILSYGELYGWTMDEIVTRMGHKNNCTVCGVFRRQALDRGAIIISADKIATGHNADDMAETVLMNVLRGDSSRLSRCTSILTDSSKNPTKESHDNTNPTEECLPRCKPLKYCYQKEIVMYAHFKKLDYFATECTYAPNSFRGHVRSFIKDLERMHPPFILDIIRSGEQFYKSGNDKSIFSFNKSSNSMEKDCQCLTHDNILDACKVNQCSSSLRANKNSLKECNRCSYISSQTVCKACTLLEGLNSGRADIGIGKASKIRNKNLKQ